MSLLNGSRSSPVVDIGALLDASAVEYLVSLVTSGALVSIFRTRDGGALGFTVTLDGDAEKEYFRTAEEVADWLRQVDHVVTERVTGPSSVKPPRKGR